MNAPTKARRTTPSSSAITRRGDGGELVAAVQVAARLGGDLAHRDVGRFQWRELRAETLARVAGRGREQRDQPGGVATGEVGAVELRGHGVHVAGRRVGRPATEEPRQQRRPRPGSPRAITNRAVTARSSSVRRVGDRRAERRTVGAEQREPDHDGMGGGDHPGAVGHRGRASPAGSSPARSDRELGLAGGPDAPVDRRRRQQRRGHGLGAGIEHGEERVGVDVGLRDDPAARRDRRAQ